MSKLNHLGTKGEQIAKIFLTNKGYEILHSNYRFQHMEVDIICKYNNTLIFCEIKTRSTKLFGYPEEAVTKRKMKYLKICAEHYMLKHPQFSQLRFDVISIIYKNETNYEIMHFEDAFY